MDASDRVLVELREVCRAAGARLVVVFGSVARGEARPWSDVDIAIEGLAFWEGQTLGIAIGRALGREPHVVDLAEASDHLRYRIAREGVLLYEREADAWPRFRAGASLRWFDLAPIVERCAEGVRQRLRREAARQHG
jgi:predicted nucleotidyltransferase